MISTKNTTAHRKFDTHVTAPNGIENRERIEIEEERIWERDKNHSEGGVSPVSLDTTPSGLIGKQHGRR